jgi:acetylornithine deacetylase
MDSLQYAQDLIAIESTSSLSNLAITDYVEDQLKRLGFCTERIEYDDAQGVRKASVVGKKGEGGGGGAYFGHTDVVPAANWFSKEHGPFTPTVADGKLFGRGACDMKGSVACMLAAASSVAERRLRRPIYITCTADEEIGYGGAKQVAERSQLYREMVEGNSYGVIGEPTALEVVYAHKGGCVFKAVSRGVAAHSSTPKGVNANLAMIPFLAEMKEIHDESESDPAWRNDEFQPPTIRWNIGINDFTTAINVTPPQSVCTVCFRPMPGQDAEVLLRRARQAAQRCGVEFEVIIRGDALYVDPQSPYVREVLELAGKERPRTVGYGTDGSVLTGMRKLVVIGPGDIAQAHTDDEWIALEQLERGAEIYRRFIAHWCC